MPRQKEFNEINALEAAMYAFWRKGYDATSLNDLESSMSLTRTSIYNTFGNKQKLFEKVIQHYQKAALGELLFLLDDAKNIQEGIKKFLYGIVDFHFKKNTPGGCLIVLSILEREQHQPETTRILEQAIQTMQKILYKHIKNAKDAGEINGNSDPRIIATTIVTAVTGLIVMGKAGFSKATLRDVSNTICGLLVK